MKQTTARTTGNQFGRYVCTDPRGGLRWPPLLWGPGGPLLKKKKQFNGIPVITKGAHTRLPEGRRIEGADKVVVRPGTSSSVKVAPSRKARSP